MRDERKRVRYIRDDSTFALDQLEANLAAHAFDPAYASKRIDLSAIPRVSRDAELAARTHIGLLSSPSIPMSREQSLQLGDSRTSTPMISTTTTAGATTTTAAVGAGAGAVYSAEAKEKAEQTAQMFSEFGPVLSSSTSPTALTESETEYTVACYKHVFARHIVFQFDCVNTLNECILEHVYVDMTTDDDIDSVLRPLNAAPIDSLSYNSPKSTYVAFELLLPDSLLDGSCPIASFDCLLKFKVVDCDPSTLEKLDPEDPGFDDEYLLESVDLAEADYCCPDYFFDWNALFDSYSESLQSFALPHLHTINACVQNLIDLLGLYSLDLASNSLPLPDSLKAH
ncbi:Coatomer subunit gamma-1, partial [Zancudomyces culisetae]